MTTTTVSLQDLAQRITQQETQLRTLRREYQTRREQLATLMRRKQQLEAQLGRVEAGIAAVTQGGASRTVTPPPSAIPAKRGTPLPRSKPSASGSLPDLLITLLREAKGQPLSPRQLTDAVKRRGYTTTSRNLYELVKSRVKELVRKGSLRRAPNRAGLLLGKETKRSVATDRKAPTAVRKAPVASPAGGPAGSLRELLIHLFQNSQRSMTARDLARQALANGYRTDSKDFPNVVKVTLKKMKEVERAPEGGYRLKKSKG